MNAATIKTTDGFTLSFGPELDSRVVEAHVVDGKAMIKARDEKAAQELQSEVSAWGAANVVEVR